MFISLPLIFFRIVIPIFEDLRWNEIGPSGATTLLTMLQKNHCLTNLRLAGNGVPPFVQKQIGEMNLKKNFGTLILRL